MTTEQMFFADADAVDSFLKNDWQRRPRFLPRALTALPSLPDWRALCASEQVESRRIVTVANGYELTHGPFEDADPALPWTVLIQDADYHAPSLRPLLNAVPFLPRWRLEDIMLSAASTGGSVGPHVDAYDVFLLQARGQRTWQVGTAGGYTKRDAADGLRLVEPFEADQTLVAAPGDVLYLPPDVPHHGVADTDDCTTLSIGFRAPSLQDIAATLLTTASGAPRYRDAGQRAVTQPGQIDSDALDRLRAQLAQYLTFDNAQLLDTLGDLVSEPKDWLAPEPREDALPKNVDCVRLSPGSRLAFGVAGKTNCAYANAQRYAIDGTDTQAFVARLSGGAAARLPNSRGGRTLAQQLWEDGVIDAHSDKPS